ncbi:MAG: AAA family ATPase [Phycisphaerae bacterium]|nr:AAA family ATPase [Phycisphaerae bacterium]
MIKKIRIRNFKSLRDVTVELEPVTVLIGRSGTGKTNFVHALRFLRDCLSMPSEKAAGPLGGWPYVFCASVKDAANALSFEIEFEAPSIAGLFKYALSFLLTPNKDAAHVFGESLRLDDRVFFEQANKTWTQPPELVKPPSPGQPVFGRLYGIPEVTIAYIVLSKGIGCYDFPGNVLMKGRQASESAALTDDAGNYLMALDAIERDLSDYERKKDMLAALQRLNSAITNVELTDDRSHIHVGHKVGDAKVLSFDLSQESESFRRFLSHMIALYQQLPKQVLVFEEPEKGIYPGALAVLADHFQAVADSGRSQVILTTHSPQLLKHFKPRQIRVVTMDVYETKIGPMAPEQRESLEEHLMSADELLTVDEARIDTSSSTSA